MRKVLLITMLSLSFVMPSICLGDRESAQSGSINLESTTEKKDDPYNESQDEAIQYFKNMASATLKYAQGSVSKLPEASDQVLNYLSGVYLYCASASGTCPLVLETILEIDVINSRVSGTVSCPNMKRYWNNWVQNGLEERQKFMVKTAAINDYGKFITQQRPRFLKCAETVQNEISGVSSNELFFKDRYRSNTPQSAFAQKLVSLLEGIKEKVPNVFIATGAINANKPATAAAPKNRPGAAPNARRAPLK